MAAAKKRKNDIKTMKGFKVLANRRTAWDAYSMWTSLPDPDRVIEKLGITKDEAYKDLLTDSHLTSVREQRRAKVKKLEWDLDVGKSTDAATTEIKAILGNVDMSSFIDNVLQYFDYGASFIEPYWKYDGRFIVPEKLVGLPNRWFLWNIDNEPRFKSTENWLDGIPFPEEKVIITRNVPTYDNPYGDAGLSKVYWPITFKRNGMKWLNIFVEKYAMPWLIAGTAPDLGETQTGELLDSLKNMVQDGIIVVPGYRSDNEIIKMVEPGGRSGSRSSDIYLGMMGYMNSEISKVYVGQTLTTQEGDTGSYAQAKVHEHVADDRRDQDRIAVEKAGNTLVKLIYRLNFGTGPAPEFIMREPYSVDTSLVERDVKLKSMGVKFTEDYYKREYNLEDGDFEISEPEPQEGPGMPFDKKNQNQPGDKPKPGGKPEFSQNFADTVSRFKDQAAVDSFLASLKPEQLQEMAEGLLKPVISLIEESNDYSEVMEKLLMTMPYMKAETAEEMLLQGIFVSEAIGRFSADKGV